MFHLPEDDEFAEPQMQTHVSLPQSSSASSFGRRTGAPTTHDQAFHSGAHGWWMENEWVVQPPDVLQGIYRPCDHYDPSDDDPSDDPSDDDKFDDHGGAASADLGSNSLCHHEKVHGTAVDARKEDDRVKEGQPEQPNQAEQQSVSVVPTTPTSHNPLLTQRKRAKSCVYQGPTASDCHGLLVKFCERNDKSKRDPSTCSALKEIEQRTRKMQRDAKCDQRIATGLSPLKATFDAEAWAKRRFQQVCDYMSEMNAQGKILTNETQYQQAVRLCRLAALQVAKEEIKTPGSMKSLKTGSPGLWAIVFAQEARARMTGGHDVKQSLDGTLQDARRAAHQVSWDGLAVFVESLKGQTVSCLQPQEAKRKFDTFIPGDFATNAKKIDTLKSLLERAGDTQSIREEIYRMQQPSVYQFRSSIQTGLCESASTARSSGAGPSGAGSPFALTMGDMTNAASRKRRLQNHPKYGSA